MRTLADIDDWYEELFTKAKLDAEARGVERANRRIVLNMRRENIPLETIAELMDLTIEEIEQLSSLPAE
jgi:predicted transposase YdaD